MVEVAPNTILFREGEYGDRFFVVVEGEIEIIKALGTADERLIAVRKSGEYVGEMSLLNRDGLRTATVRTRARTRLMVMTRANFDELLHRYPALAYEMVRVLSLRLNEAHGVAIRDLHEKNRQLSDAYEELKAAHAQIVEKEILEKELAIARQIQESILPREMPTLAGFDFGARMESSRAVGGDLFDLFSLDDNRVGIAVADVSDKGVPAAIFMALSRSLLRAEASRVASPVEVLRNVNAHLLEMNDAGLFVTVLYGVLDATTREFHYARAGHELPLKFDATGALDAPAHQAGMSLGLFDDPRLDEQRLTLLAGCTLVINSDGITDQIDEQGVGFDEERLIDAVRALSRHPAQVICDGVFDAVRAYCGNAAQTDDMTIVVVRAE
ncbi:MAG: SpoIIE family protein phosphatase [Chloroflexota bacterium]|nr:SpoIIE family protein phosphatase [Chloroflexota bacterium]